MIVLAGDVFASLQITLLTAVLLIVIAGMVAGIIAVLSRVLGGSEKKEEGGDKK